MYSCEFTIEDKKEYFKKLILIGNAPDDGTLLCKSEFGNMALLESFIRLNVCSTSKRNILPNEDRSLSKQKKVEVYIHKFIHKNIRSETRKPNFYFLHKGTTFITSFS